MFAKIQQLIERQVHKSVRKTILDWPMDFGIETAVMNGVSGDYHEFGVFRGRSFIKNAQHLLKTLPADESAKINFWAYDSFEGLPETHDQYAPAHFTKGAFSAPLELFLKNVAAAGIDMNRVQVVEGFYDKSLSDDAAKRAFATRKVGVAYIDCDIYESTVPIFKFLNAGLQVGSVIVIDDWLRHHAHPNHGIQRAFNEWLAANTRIKVTQIALTKRAAFVVYAV